MIAASATNSRPAPRRYLAHGANASPDEAFGHLPVDGSATTDSGPALGLDHYHFVELTMPGDDSSVAAC